MGNFNSFSRAWLSVCCAIVALTLFVPRAIADTLYGLTSSVPGTIYTVNTSTGGATIVLNISNATSLVGLAALNGQLYATDVVAGNGFSFGSIDLATGAFTAINNQSGSANWHSLAANAGGNFFYTVDLNDANRLKTVTPGGVVTTIGGTGLGVVGLSYDAGAGILYAENGTDLYRLNTSTGAATLIGALGLTTFRSDLAFDAATNTLYLNSGDAGALYRVNTSTGLATLIGSNGPTNGFGIDGITFGNVTASGVPLPGTATAGALLLGAIGLGKRRRI